MACSTFGSRSVREAFFAPATPSPLKQHWGEGGWVQLRLVGLGTRVVVAQYSYFRTGSVVIVCSLGSHWTELNL